MLNASAPKRVLIIKLQHHGDVLLATPVADALKQAWPDCEIDMLVYAATADVLRDNRQLRRVFGIDRQWKKLGARHHLAREYALFAHLRAQHYDWVIRSFQPMARRLGGQILRQTKHRHRL